jgi:hypothetical protein
LLILHDFERFFLKDVKDLVIKDCSDSWEDVFNTSKKTKNSAANLPNSEFKFVPNSANSSPSLREALEETIGGRISAETKSKVMETS